MTEIRIQLHEAGGLDVWGTPALYHPLARTKEGTRPIILTNESAAGKCLTRSL